MRMRTLILLAMILGLFASAGCSRFSSSKRLNLAPFAEDMIAVAGDIQYGLGQNYAVYLRGYGETPEAAHMQRLAAKVRELIRGTISYALEVVALADSRMPGPERAQALGNKLDSLLRPVVMPPTAPLNISEAELNAILDDVRAQESLVDGLSAAQPLINEIARVAGEIFEDTKLALDATAAVTQQRITTDIAPVLEQDRMLRDFQLRATASMGLIARYRHGDAAALDSLVAIVPSLTEVISVEDGVSGAEMAVIEERMVYLLQTISEVRRQLEPDRELFWNQQAELEQLVASFNTALRQARVAVVAWSRAHQRLASGITDPAEIDIFGLAKKAAGTYF
jgi:hypothetical protein